jgi:pimeloyl-ACP methyl ester carboxylesterase
MLSNISSRWTASLVLLLRLASFSAAQVNASTLISSSTTCGPQCQYLAAAAFSFETQAHATADLPFYKVPENFSASLAPGSLLRVEHVTNLTNYTVPSGLTMSRIIYTTTNLNGTILPASAYILWPYVFRKEYSMVAWAHGTSGLFKACAPSNYRSLQYHFMVPYLLAMQGMVVVAPDYAGLGFDTLPSGEHFAHPWALCPAQANDLAHAITAARAAFPQQLPRKGPFVAMGHSQGGGAAWAFAQRLVQSPMDGYKGTVAIAPTTDVVGAVAAGLANSSLPQAPYVLILQPKLIASVTALFPAYNFSGFTPMAADRWFNVMAPLSACLPTDVGVFADVPVDQLAQPGWLEHPAVQRFAEVATSGRKRFQGPLLVVTGDKDAADSVESVGSAFNVTCTMNKQNNWNQSLEMVTYAGVDHFPIIQASQLLWLDWVKARLSGKEVPKPGCKASAVDGFRADSIRQSTAPNFLVDWVGQQESWKYIL